MRTRRFMRRNNLGKSHLAFVDVPDLCVATRPITLSPRAGNKPWLSVIKDSASVLHLARSHRPRFFTFVVGPLSFRSVMTTVPPSNAQGVRANKLVALPSLSCALSSLPQATSLDSVSLHPNMYAQRAAESEAKLKKVLSKTAASQPQTPPPPAIPTYMNPSQYNQNSPNSSPPLMMRKSQKPKFHA